MSDEMIAMFQNAVPFANTVGIKIHEMADGRAVASVTVREEIANHLGTLHAGATFTLAETASGCAMSSVFGPKIFELRPVAAESTIGFKKLAKGTITAKAATTLGASEILSTLESDGKVRFGVDVDLIDEEEDIVATVSVDWHVSPHR